MAFKTGALSETKDSSSPIPHLGGLAIVSTFSISVVSASLIEQPPNGINSLIAAMLPDGMDIVGRPIQDSETENSLPDDLGGDPVRALENEISEIEDKWQDTYSNIEFEVRVEDDGGGGAYIQVSADYFAEIPMGQIEGVPGYQHVEWLASELNEHDWSGANSRQYERTRNSYGSSRDIQHIETFTGHGHFTTRGGGTQSSMIVSLNLNMEAFDENGNGWFGNASDFEDACILMNEMDDKTNGIEEEIMRYLKREGFAAGGAYMQLAREIEDGDIDSLEWDVETDGEYEDSYESYAQYTHHYDYESGPFKSNPEVLEKLLNSREYRVLLRQNILATPKARVGTEYNLTVDGMGTQVVGNYVRHYTRFKITADDPSESVELFKELVTGEMDDEENLNVPHNKTLAAIMQQNRTGQWGDDVQERLIKESKDETTRHVNRWREFIRSK